MMTSLRQMLTCHWSARRIQRYLDRDPSAPLTQADIARLEGHLAVCAGCAGVLEEYARVREMLHAWSEAAAPDPAAVSRLQASVDSILADNV